MNILLRVVHKLRSMVNDDLLQILNQLPFKVDNLKRVSGGDINEAFRIDSGAGKFFLKLNNLHAYPGMFEQEVKGLKILSEHSSLRLPQIIDQGSCGNQQYLLLKWLDVAAPAANTMKDFGTALASLHKIPQANYGWEADNYIGSLPQVNTCYDDWAEFYAKCRIRPLVFQLNKKGLMDSNDLDLTNKLCARLSQLFPPEPASLLHGDLWSGNFMVTHTGVAVFDPAVYYGHREMDLGMSRLFGGFPQAFYDAYAEAYPLQQGWQERVELTQLYPLLVHAILFGGSYVHGARSIVKKYSGSL